MLRFFQDTPLWLTLVVIPTLLAACAPPSSPSVPQPADNPEFKGRKIANVMPFSGASWLERDSRLAEENPEALVSALPIELGDTVVDMGCGSGFYARLLSQRVGPLGKVLCVDIQPEMIALARKLADEAGISNIEFVLSEPEDPKLEPSSIDLLLMVDVYHELINPATMLADIREALVQDGVAALAEYRLEGDSADWIHIEHRMSVEQVKKEWLPAGFQLLEQVDDLPSQHLFLFTKSP